MRCEMLDLIKFIDLIDEIFKLIAYFKLTFKLLKKRAIIVSYEKKDN